MTGREPGFAGMIAAGMSPAEAWQAIRDELAADPAALAILMSLAETAEGRDALDSSRQAWARHGLPPPWGEKVPP